MDGPSNNSTDGSSQETRSPNLDGGELPRNKQRVSKEQEKGDKGLSTTDGASSLVAPAPSAPIRPPEAPLFVANYNSDDNGRRAEGGLAREADGRMGESPKEDGEYSNQVNPDFKKLLEVLPRAMTERTRSDGTVRGHSSANTPAVDEGDRSRQDGAEDGRQSETASVSPRDHSPGYVDGDSRSSEADILKRARYYILSMERERKQLLEENRELQKRFEDHYMQQDKLAGT